MSTPSNPNVVETNGALPPFHSESAVFFANLLGLFFGNQGKTELLNNAVSGIDSYGGRLVPIIDLLFRGQKNLLTLDRKPPDSICGYFRETLGLSLPEMRALPYNDYLAVGRSLAEGDNAAAAQILGDIPPDPNLVDGFVTDPDLERIAAHLGKKTVSSAEGSHRGNDKYLLHQHLVRADLPVFETLEATSSADLPACLRTLAKAGFQNAVVKSPVGASGIGIEKLPIDASPAELNALPLALFDDGPCMVQGWMERGIHGVARIRSPSVQLYLNDDHVYLYDVTEQILSGDSVHEGNESPPPYLDQIAWIKRDLFGQAAEVGTWLHSQGYRGTASVDFLLAYFEEKKDPEIRICEINARVTGATYPSVLAHHFIPHGAWLMRNLTFKKPIPGDYLLLLLDSFGHLFRPGGDAAGVLPINFVTGEDGLVIKGQFLCLADLPERCHPLFNHVRRDLPVEWEYSRD